MRKQARNNREHLYRLAAQAKRRRKIRNWIDKIQEILMLPMFFAIIWCLAAMYGK